MQPRLLSHKDAARYCGMSEPHFRAHIEPHVPALSFGAKRLWDVRGIDVYLDTLTIAGVSSTPATDWLERLE